MKRQQADKLNTPEDAISRVLKKSQLLVCKKCGKEMTGYPGDDECYECYYPDFAKASKAACKAVEKAHFERTGERKTAGELLRETLGMHEKD